LGVANYKVAVKETCNKFQSIVVPSMLSRILLKSIN